MVPLQAFAAAARARALFKWRKSATYAAGLVANPVARERGSVRALTWSETGVRWLRRMGLPSPPDDHNADAGDPLGRDVRKAVIEHGLENDALRAGRRWQLYEEYQLADTAKELHKLQRAGWFGGHWSTTGAVAMRTGAFDTARSLARRGAQPARFLEACPFCESHDDVGEDVAHLLVECPRWRAARSRFLLPVWRAAGVLDWLAEPARRLDLAYILLGGRVGPHRGPSMTDDAARGVQFPLGASCANWLVNLSRFLRAVGPLRLWELRRTASKSQRRLPGGRTRPGGPEGQRGSD